jgi:hypothetical protein
MQRHLDLRHPRMGHLEAHDAWTLRFHLGKPTVPTVLESTHHGEETKELGIGRQHRQEDAGNHLRTRPQSVAHGESADRPPQTREVVEGYPWRDVCYCKYSDGVRWTYKKQTRLWGVIPTFVPRPVCSRKDPCALSASGKHPDCAQRCNRGRGKNHTLNELYSMPTQLTEDIAQAAAELSSL